MEGVPSFEQSTSKPRLTSSFHAISSISAAMALLLAACSPQTSPLDENKNVIGSADAGQEKDIGETDRVEDLRYKQTQEISALRDCTQHFTQITFAQDLEKLQYINTKELVSLLEKKRDGAPPNSTQRQRSIILIAQDKNLSERNAAISAADRKASGQLAYERSEWIAAVSLFLGVSTQYMKVGALNQASLQAFSEIQRALECMNKVPKTME